MSRITFVPSVMNYVFDYENYFKNFDKLGLLSIVEAFLDDRIDSKYVSQLTVEEILLDLIHRSNSIDEVNKEIWKILIPVMSKEQVKKLVIILGKEHDKVTFIEEFYKSREIAVKKEFLEQLKKRNNK